MDKAPMTFDSNEERVRMLFEEKGLQCKRFTTKECMNRKTPDFRVYKSADFYFFCEVKGVLGDKWLENMMKCVPVETLVLETRPDPAFNRLTNDIHQAVKQFDSVNPDHEHANVLVFCNNPGSLSNFEDLLSVLTGRSFFDDGDESITHSKYAEGRIRLEKARIDLYVWIEENGQPFFRFTNVNHSHFLHLCEWLKKDPEGMSTLAV
jgi:hypothetical protein